MTAIPSGIASLNPRQTLAADKFASVQIHSCKSLPHFGVLHGSALSTPQRQPRTRPHVLRGDRGKMRRGRHSGLLTCMVLCQITIA
jgi:hypothetical protein